MKEWLIKVRKDGKRPDAIIMMSDHQEPAEKAATDLNARYKEEDYYVERFDKDNPPLIKVYRREEGDPRSYSPDRPWMVARIPEDSRETCYPTWEAAMAWATMPTQERQAWLDEEAKMDGGW